MQTNVQEDQFHQCQRDPQIRFTVCLVLVPVIPSFLCEAFLATKIVSQFSFLLIWRAFFFNALANNIQEYNTE